MGLCYQSGHCVLTIMQAASLPELAVSCRAAAVGLHLRQRLQHFVDDCRIGSYAQTWQQTLAAVHCGDSATIILLTVCCYVLCLPALA